MTKHYAARKQYLTPFLEDQQERQSSPYTKASHSSYNKARIPLVFLRKEVSVDRKKSRPSADSEIGRLPGSFNPPEQYVSLQDDPDSMSYLHPRGIDRDGNAPPNYDTGKNYTGPDHLA